MCICVYYIYYTYCMLHIDKYPGRWHFASIVLLYSVGQKELMTIEMLKTRARKARLSKILTLFPPLHALRKHRNQVSVFRLCTSTHVSAGLL